MAKPFQPYSRREALKILRGKTYEDVFALPMSEIRRLVLAFPHPGNSRTSRATLKDGRSVSLRRIVLTPHTHLKPPGVPMREWLAGLSNDERLGHEFHLQHKKLLFSSLPREEIVYASRKDWLADHLIDRLPENHPLRIGQETVIAAHDSDGKLAGFITGLTTKRKSALIGYVCVAPQYRRTGLTKRLYARLWRELASQGARVVLGEVEPFGEKESAEHAELLRKRTELVLSARERSRLAALTQTRDRLRILSTHGRLLVEGVPYVVPVFDGSRRVLPMSLVATVLQRNARGGVSLNPGGALSLRELEKAVLDIHSSQFIYVSNCHSLPVLRTIFERLKHSGVKSFPLVRFSNAA